MTKRHSRSVNNYDDDDGQRLQIGVFRRRHESLIGGFSLPNLPGWALVLHSPVD
jgi:hypothetical protein